MGLADGVADLLAGLKTKIGNKLDDIQWQRFTDDFGENADLLKKFDDSPDLVDSWKVLYKGDADEATRISKFGDVKKYLDANPSKSVDDVAKEIKDAKGYQKWSQKRIGTKNTLQEVDEIFDDFYNLSFVKKGETIRPAWKHIDNGCNVRAHLLAEELNARGFETRKIFAFHVGSFGEAKLKVPSKFAKDALENFDQVNSVQTWQWHVATILTSGKHKGKIIDPALSNKPLSVKEWMNKMGANEYKAIGRNDAKKIVAPDGNHFTETPPVYTIVEDDYFNANDLWLEKRYLKPGQIIEDNIPTVKGFMDLEKYNVIAQDFRRSLEQGKTEIDHYINLTKKY